MTKQELTEYHCVIGSDGTDDQYKQLIEYLQEEAVYTNSGFESTPVKGPHVHICVIFAQPYSPAWKKQLDRLRKELDFVKKHKDNGRGWYWRPATTENNLAYILKPETKTQDNIEWYSTNIIPDMKQLIETYVNKSHEAVGHHQKHKNKRYEEIKAYIAQELKDKVDFDKYDIGMAILSCYRNHLDSLLPTKSVFNSILNTYLYDHHIVSREELVNHMIDI